jgi:MFS family permease
LTAGTARSLGKQFPAYGTYLLLTVYTFCFLDRQVINILAESIKRDLGLSDTQLGLLTGLSFAILYTAFAIPIARLAESRSRSKIIVSCLVVWSAFTMLCGIAKNLSWLLITRVGVGVGEAGCLPASHSMISEYLPRERRAWSLAIFHVGAPLGLLLGMAIGGIVAARYGWRAAFFAAGAPGLVLAVLVRFLLPDPTRERPRISEPRRTSFGETVRELLEQKCYWLIILGASLATFVSYAQNSFIASFFFRVHAAGLSQVGHGRGPVAFIGTALGLILGIGGAIGTLAGGYFGDRLGRRGVQGYLTIASISSFLVAPLFLSALSVGSFQLALGLLIPATIVNSLWAGPVFASIQSLVQERSRATAAAIAQLCLNLIGLGLGPLTIGALSDHLAARLGPAQGLRWALAASCSMSVVSGIVFLFARRQLIDRRAAPTEVNFEVV